jgi:hypothetical protein
MAIGEAATHHAVRLSGLEHERPCDKDALALVFQHQAPVRDLDAAWGVWLGW